MPRTWYIRKDGQGDVTTIAAFFQNAASGDTGIIADSETYDENVQVSGKAGLTLKVAPGQTPVWLNAGTNLTLGAGCDNFTLEGPPDGYFSIIGGNVNYPCITVTASSLAGLTIRRVKSESSSPTRGTFISANTLSNLTVSDCRFSQANQRFLGVDALNGATIERCNVTCGDLIKCNSWTNVICKQIIGTLTGYIGAPYASTMFWAGTNEFVNCLFRDVSGSTIYSFMRNIRSSEGQQGATWRFWHCTIVKEPIAQSGTRIAIAFENSDDYPNRVLDVRDCIIAGFPQGVWSYRPWIVDYCHIPFCLTPYAGQAYAGPHAIPSNLDPLFVAYGQDYHLLPDSPDRDAGQDLGITVDLDGRIRPKGKGYDIGCYEAVAPDIYEPLPSSEIYVTDLNGLPLPGYEPLSPGRIGPDGLADIADIIITALMTDRRDDNMPPGSDRRGWWADPTWGSLLWRLMGQPMRSDTALTAKAYIESALKYLRDEGAVSSIQVGVRDIEGGIAIEVVAERRRGQGVRLRWQCLWDRYEQRFGGETR